MNHRLWHSVLVVSVLALSACGRTDPIPAPSPAPSPALPEAPAADAVPVPTDRLLELDGPARRWVDSVLAGLDTRERAAQLVMPWMWAPTTPSLHFKKGSGNCYYKLPPAY